MRVGVAVIDTGIFRHKDFDNRVAAFVDFINGKTAPYDDSGHGTHVSGIIAGSGAASGGRYRGVAPESAIISVKVLDHSGNGRIANVLKGLEWVREQREKYNIRVVNISFGTTTKDEVKDEDRLIEAVEKLWDDGMVVIAAAGNNGPSRSSVTAPGNSRKIITVGAFDDSSFTDQRNSSVRYFSGRGPTRECVVKPEVVVAGANIIACSNHKNAYSIKSGTSMAAPIVSGAVARLLKEEPQLTPKQIKVRMKQCCKKINVPDNQQGWGMLDVVKFVVNG